MAELAHPAVHADFRLELSSISGVVTRNGQVLAQPFVGVPLPSVLLFEDLVSGQAALAAALNASLEQSRS